MDNRVHTRARAPLGAGRGMRAQVKPGTLKRLLSYMSVYKIHLVVVVICIFISAAAGAASSLFLQRLIDDYINPILLEKTPVYDGWCNCNAFL